MKNKLILAILAISMVSCEKNVPSTITSYRLSDGQGTLEIVVVDSCEYLYGPWGNATVLTHKGNCKNPIHKGGDK
jgi:DNA/RNA endonuclease YhcR with UshA esterase domain